MYLSEICDWDTSLLVFWPKAIELAEADQHEAHIRRVRYHM